MPTMNNVPTRNDLQASSATSNAIRGAEQSGNIAKNGLLGHGGLEV